MRINNKITAVIISFLLIIAIISVSVFAANKIPKYNSPIVTPDVDITPKSGTCGDLSWSYKSAVLTISGSGSIPDYELTLKDDKTVSTAPWSDINYTTLLIGDDVTSIGDYAFYGMNATTNATFGKSITEIGKGAFQNSAFLSRVIINNGVTVIPQEAFSGCSSLKTLVIPSSVTEIKSDAFKDCAKLTSYIYCGTSDQSAKISGISELGSAAAQYHSFGTAYASDGLGHFHECKYCSAKSVLEAHKFEGGNICSVCSYERTFIYGNANGDDTVDMNDIVLLRQYIANYDYDTNTSTVQVNAGADANGDSKIDMNDIVLLRQYIANYDYDTNTSTVILGPREATETPVIIIK